ncbi:diguanylate cyclase [Thiobacillus sp.]|uniref:sensor domain-containing diguanylate cyclase n=1 Tax=Thiobacillus sp. TaxID=924 RepID=UPI0025F69A3D|nr:diguanylate cyclase [Thiobacillus sp.]
MRRAASTLTGWLAGLFLLVAGALAGAAPLSTAVEYDAPIGRSAAFLQEADARLELADAAAAFRAGRLSPGSAPVLSFGIGARPVWIRFAVDNPAAAPATRRLSVETAWLDRIEVYVLNQGRVVAAHRGGDRQPFMQRAVMSRAFMFDHDFAPSASEVFVRVETPDPMVVPIYFESRESSRLRQMQQQLSYGLVYGFLLALIAYNAILYASLRTSSYLSYALYLLAFIAMNVAYTGHGFAWLWPGATGWQQWSHPALIVAYGIAGLMFALRFLELRANFPRLRRAVIAYCAAGAGLLAAAILAGSQEYALLVAFGFVFAFTLVMPALGILAVRAGQKAARYFLLAACAAMVGAVLTTLSTWGFIPFNGWTFRAVEIGMLADATLLALALAYRFRVGQEERLRAERLAQLDPLTGLSNRRAFYDLTTPLWSNALRHGHDLSVVLLDLDRFKQLNDSYGHAHGDAVLKAVAGVLRNGVRQGDVLARWGGEEFIVLLPETGGTEAAALAERLRAAIAALRVPREDGETRVTASFGVARLEDRGGTLDALIAHADANLYRAKDEGRNRVACCLPKARRATADSGAAAGAL